MKIDEKVLIKKAQEVRQKAYAPYSGFTVGAAILCKDGSIYTGCNVENAAYPAGTCAERVALGKAVSEGAKDFVDIAIVGGIGNERVACTPCGMCRQALSEFVCDDFIFIIEEKDPKSISMAELLPGRFSAESLK